MTKIGFKRCLDMATGRPRGAKVGPKGAPDETKRSPREAKRGHRDQFWSKFMAKMMKMARNSCQVGKNQYRGMKKTTTEQWKWLNDIFSWFSWGCSMILESYFERIFEMTFPNFGSFYKRPYVRKPWFLHCFLIKTKVAVLWEVLEKTEFRNHFPCKNFLKTQRKFNGKFNKEINRNWMKIWWEL